MIKLKDKLRRVIKKPDLLDTKKYKRRGAYHWSNYRTKPEKNKEYHMIIDYFKSMEVNTGQSIIDIGCGDGVYTKLLSIEGYNICGIDANPLAVKLARSEGVTNVTHSFLLDYHGKHDVALLIDSFEHFNEPARSIEHLNNIILERIYILNPLWEEPEEHYDFYDTPKLTNLFSECWKLKHEKLFKFGRKSLIKSFLQFEKK